MVVTIGIKKSCLEYTNCLILIIDMITRNREGERGERILFFNSLNTTPWQNLEKKIPYGSSIRWTKFYWRNRKTTNVAIVESIHQSRLFAKHYIMFRKNRCKSMFRRQEWLSSGLLLLKSTWIYNAINKCKFLSSNHTFDYAPVTSRSFLFVKNLAFQ
jgi:hypothetical protein